MAAIIVFQGSKFIQSLESLLNITLHPFTAGQSRVKPRIDHRVNGGGVIDWSWDVTGDQKLANLHFQGPPLEVLPPHGNVTVYTGCWTCHWLNFGSAVFPCHPHLASHGSPGLGERPLPTAGAIPFSSMARSRSFSGPRPQWNQWHMSFESYP